MNWYELIHRPIGLGTHPKGAFQINPDHVNRDGFKFGKVAYERKLTKKEMFDFDLEPISKIGWVEVGRVTQEILNQAKIKTTASVVGYLVENGMVTVESENGFDYIQLSEIEWLAKNEETALRDIYKELRKGVRRDGL
ncbi:hypothetical protein [Jeotgalibaca porci]|uniref:defense against restriction DarA-related protein n=1 Tax=Jeotgalibaca porci TaxID=1868793 RepID=UPI00359FAB83